MTLSQVSSMTLSQVSSMTLSQVSSMTLSMALTRLWTLSLTRAGTQKWCCPLTTQHLCPLFHKYRSQNNQWPTLNSDIPFISLDSCMPNTYVPWHETLRMTGERERERERETDSGLEGSLPLNHHPDLVMIILMVFVFHLFANSKSFQHCSTGVKSQWLLAKQKFTGQLWMALSNHIMQRRCKVDNSSDFTAEAILIDRLSKSSIKWQFCLLS